MKAKPREERATLRFLISNTKGSAPIMRKNEKKVVLSSDGIG